jgi:uncharacterized membrane protein
LTPAFATFTILGGFAAPSFLLLAGIGLALAAEAAVQRTGDRRAAMAAAIRRGAGIFVLAFLFRLQALIVTPGSPFITLFKVDILNIMGPALMAAGLVWGIVRHRLALIFVFGALATAMTMATPIVRDADWVSALPVWLQWHMRPAGEHTSFTLFPWAGFVFVGAGLGMVLESARTLASERRRQASIALAGAALVLAGFQMAELPTIYRSSSFWTSSPTFFAIRVGVIMVAISLLFAISLFPGFVRRALNPLERLGKGSLFVYWIHVELVYGYASWFLRQKLDLAQVAVACLIFCALMYGALVVRDAALARWTARASARSPSIIVG